VVSGDNLKSTYVKKTHIPKEEKGKAKARLAFNENEKFCS